MRDFKQLKVWEKAHRLALDVYRATREFPSEERFGLTIQLRRAAVSVPSNIAEGCGRAGNKELAHFMSMAAGSVSEVEYQLLLARDLGFVSKERHQHLDGQTTEVRRMLNSFMKKLNRPDG
jgi:four helix bundle protein